MYVKFYHFILFVYVLLSMPACNQQVSENIERGDTYTYRAGYPEVSVSAIGFFDENRKPGINITAEIVKGSLVYSHSGDSLQAQVNTGIEIKNRETDKTVQRKAYSFTISSDNESITNSQDRFFFKKRMEVSPGKYTVLVTVVDKSSGKKITRVTQTTIPSFNDKDPHLTDVQLLKKNSEAEIPVFSSATSYHIPSKFDSLAFRFQITNAVDDTLDIRTWLMKFKADSTIARDMSDPDYASATIEYEGIEYDRRTILQENTRRIIQPRNVMIEFKIPTPERGNYRFDVIIESGNNTTSSSLANKARDFSVKSENFPTPETPKELARPLAYLMGDKEYKKMMSNTSSDSLKKAVDKFWLSNIKNRQNAKDVIAKYYERVELANKQFSNFKEGWKTDMGMIFILFGRPWYVDEFSDEVQWSYSYNHEEFESNYFFFQPTFRNKYFPFEHWILDRHRDYFNTEFRQRRNWKSGNILTQPLVF